MVNCLLDTAFAKLKAFNIFSITYRNRRKRFDLRMNLIVGFINFEYRLLFAGNLLRNLIGHSTS